jgi:uncharacterized radical SAM superfamily protein
LRSRLDPGAGIPLGPAAIPPLPDPSSRPWTEIAAGIEAIETVDLDPVLVTAFEAARRPAPGGIHFYTPGFKTYATAEIEGCGKRAWPAVSITGGDCALQCDHCRAKILEPMIPARTPEALWRVANEQIASGALGMLLSGGSNRRDEVEYGPYYPTIRRIRDAFPQFRIALHTALVTPAVAREMADAGIDAAMMDVIGAQDTVSQVYHLRRRVDDFEASLAALVATPMKVVPHIVVGLHYGRLLGEWRALEIVRRHRPAALVLVVVMPFYAPSGRSFETPAPRDVGRFFLDARQALPDLPLLLGCARPPGRVKVEIDSYAALAGLDGIAHPSEGVVELALRIGREVRVSPVCCSIVLGDEVLALDEANAAIRIDPQAVIANERALTARRPGRFRGIPVVTAGLPT